MAMALKKGLRERKKTKTRDAIIATAYRMFIEKGYDATRIEDIADDIDISPRTFFRYFPTKETVVFHEHKKNMEMFTKAINYRAYEKETPFEAVKRACVVISREYLNDKDNKIVQLNIIQSSPSLVGYAEILDTDYEEIIAAKLLENTGGDAIKERRARIMSHVVMGLIRGGLHEWFMNGCTENLVQMSKDTLAIIDSIIE